MQPTSLKSQKLKINLKLPVSNSESGPPLPVTPPRSINTLEAILLEIKENNTKNALETNFKLNGLSANMDIKMKIFQVTGIPLHRQTSNESQFQTRIPL